MNGTNLIESAMNSRSQILAAVQANQPDLNPLPLLDSFFESSENDQTQRFTHILSSIGGRVIEVDSNAEISIILKENFDLETIRTVSGIKDIMEHTDTFDISEPHALSNVELAILPAHFAVAENGACWINESILAERVLPFITQHLVLVVNKSDILPTMHHAYQKIGDESYGFGTFIAGPSKTADIEQSLVLGAHGARSLLVFLI